MAVALAVGDGTLKVGATIPRGFYRTMSPRIREILFLDEQDKREPAIDSEIQAVSIGPVAFVSIPGELFCPLGRRIKRAFPFPVASVVTRPNKTFGYLPTAEAFVVGGYEVRFGRPS